MRAYWSSPRPVRRTLQSYIASLFPASDFLEHLFVNASMSIFRTSRDNRADAFPKADASKSPVVIDCLTGNQNRISIF